MTDWYSGDVVANGLRIHYYRTGGDKPPLVLSHGATDSGLCWTRLARALESDYDVIMPDARGHGLSEEPKDGYASDARAADLAGFIRALGLEKPAVGGHSMGAQTTFYLLANDPGLVRCAILEDPVFRPRDDQPGDADRLARAEQMRRTMEENRALGRDGIIAKGRALHPAWAEEEFGPWADAKLNVKPSFAEVRPPERLLWWEELPKQTTPTLLVTGDPELGAIVTPDVAREAARLQPNLKVVRLSGAGHNVRREQFEGFVQAVRAFLAAADRDS
jgi:pimeloyl-ACP methyl ester carboxylesterase